MLLQSAPLASLTPVRSTLTPLGTAQTPALLPSSRSGSYNMAPLPTYGSQSYTVPGSSSFQVLPTVKAPLPTAPLASYSLAPWATSPLVATTTLSTSLPTAPLGSYSLAPLASYSLLPTEPELVTTEPEVIEAPIEIEETPDSYFTGVNIEKPTTMWKTATDFHGEFPSRASAPPTFERKANSTYPGHHHTNSGSRTVETDPRYYNSLNEEPDQPYPFWIAAGTPAARIEPTWQDGNWYMVAPVDFKGIENYKSQGKWTPAMEFDALNTVDQAVRDLDAQGNIAAMPPPRHWKEHKSCPIA